MSSTDKKKRFLDETVAAMSKVGLPAMDGRIFALLLISDPPGRSTSQICEALGASKSHVSTATRFLVQIGLIEKFRVAGSRETYFRTRRSVWADLMTKRMEFISDMRAIAEDGLAITDPASPAHDRLADMHDLYAFLEQEMPALMEQWTEKRRRK